MKILSNLFKNIESILVTHTEKVFVIVGLVIIIAFFQSKTLTGDEQELKTRMELAALGLTKLQESELPFCKQELMVKNICVKGSYYKICENKVVVSFTIENTSDVLVADLPSWGFLDKKPKMIDEFNNEYYVYGETDGVRLYPKRSCSVTLQFGMPVDKSKKLWVKIPVENTELVFFLRQETK